MGEIWEKPKQHDAPLGLWGVWSLEDCISLQPRCRATQLVSQYLWREEYKGNGWWDRAVGVYKISMELHLWDRVWCWDWEGTSAQQQSRLAQQHPIWAKKQNFCSGTAEVGGQWKEPVLPLSRGRSGNTVMCSSHPSAIKMRMDILLLLL